MQLREYQEKHLNALYKAKHNTIVQSPTGTGKTIEIYTYTQERLKAGTSGIMILAPNRRVVDTIAGYFDGGVSKVYATSKPDYSNPIMVSTYHSAGRHKQFYKPELIIVDEVHHIRAQSWQRLIEGTEAHGWTATPNRLDGKPLYPLFKDLILSPSIKWFIDKGYLAPYEIIALECPLFSSKRGDALDIQEKIFGNITSIKKTIETWQKHSCDKRTIIFASTIKHGQLLEDYYKSLGVSAVCITSKMGSSYQQLYFNQFKTGEMQVLINVQMFTEGIDVPAADAVYLCRFTYSVALYLQMVGRVLRPNNGAKAQIVDLANNVYYHGSPGLEFPWSITGETYRESDNQSSVYARCEQCNHELIHKKDLPVYPNFVKMKCPNCGHENNIPGHLTVQRKSSNRLKQAKEFFTLVDFQTLNVEVITEFTRLVYNKKIKQYNKITSIVMFEGIEKAPKRKALLHLGLETATIDYYLED